MLQTFAVTVTWVRRNGYTSTGMTVLLSQGLSFSVEIVQRKLAVNHTYAYIINVHELYHVLVSWEMWYFQWCFFSI